MSTRIRNPDPRDPLEAYSGLTLFPRTLASIPLAPKPSDPSDPHAVHDFLKSMPLEGSDKLIEQAKAIIGSCSGVSNSMHASFLNSKDENETVAAKVIENPQERRPALGRKRARFSLKPNSSQPTVSLEPILDMDKLKDPEEFFLAFEKLENAKRELQKQTGGVSMDLNQPNPSLASRPRRPGLLGRSVKYKHHYSNDICSKDSFKENILSSTDLGVQQETANSNAAFEERESDDDELQEMKADSVAEAENKVNELLGELLANHPEELDGDGTVTLLQEHLQIKPIDVEKLCIPDLQHVRRLDLKASGPNLPKPRSALSDIQNVLKGISSKTPKTHRQAESTVACLASPTPPRSPLDSIISLKKRIQQSKSITDPFSALNIDKTPARNDSPVGSIKEQTARGNTVKETEENNIADMNLSVPEVADKSVDGNMSIPGSGIFVNPSGSNAYVNDNDGGSCVDSRVVNETSGSPDTDADIWTNEVNEVDHKMEDTLKEAEDSVEHGCSTQAVNEPDGLDEKMEDTLKEVEDSVEPGPNTGASNEPNGLDDKMGDTLKETVESVQPVENLNAQSLLDEADPAVVEEHVVDAPPKIADTGPKHHNEEAQISTKNPLNEESKTIAPHKKRKRKEVSRRQSLAAFGTSWQDGIRRSTRIRSRPLEYWRGERFLYGRVNQSVVSVIGIKYESPAKGKPVLKVKSFVSDEFKQQVEDAAKF